MQKWPKSAPLRPDHAGTALRCSRRLPPCAPRKQVGPVGRNTISHPWPTTQREKEPPGTSNGTSPMPLPASCSPDAGMAERCRLYAGSRRPPQLLRYWREGPRRSVSGRAPSKSRFVPFVGDHVSRAQPYIGALIPGRKAESSLRHTRTFGAYLDFDGALQ